MRNTNARVGKRATILIALNAKEEFYHSDEHGRLRPGSVCHPSVRQVTKEYWPLAAMSVRALIRVFNTYRINDLIGTLLCRPFKLSVALTRLRAGVTPDTLPVNRETVRTVPFHSPIDVPRAPKRTVAKPTAKAAAPRKRSAEVREFWRFDGRPRRLGDGPSGAAGLTVQEPYMAKTGGWHGVAPVNWAHCISSMESRDPRTTLFPRPVPEAVVINPSRALIAQRRRVREQLVTYTVMADALEYMECHMATRAEKKARRVRPWINLDATRAEQLRHYLHEDECSGWDSDRDAHVIRRQPNVQSSAAPDTDSDSDVSDSDVKSEPP